MRYHSPLQLIACRLLASLLIANYGTLVVLNAASTPVWTTIPVYVLACALAWWGVSPAWIRRTRLSLPRWTWWVGLVFLGLLTGPRLTYLLEWLPSRPSILATADDYGRLAELISMTQSERYPLVHPSNQRFLLSHYYTAFYPLAWLKLVFPVITLKDSILLGNFLYHCLMLAALREAASRLFTDRRRAVWFLFLLTFFSGLDWLFYLQYPFNHDGKWTQLMFGTAREISSSYTVLYWVIHHACALACVLLAGLLAREVRYRHRWHKPLVMGLLWIAAFYTSPFVTLGAGLTWLPQVWMLAKRLWSSRLIWPLAVTALPPLGLMQGRVQTQSFFWDPVPLARLPFYIPLVCLIDLAAIPLLLWKDWRRLAGAWVFLVSTMFFSSIGFNNLCMRGMMAPTFAFFLLGARTLPLPGSALAIPALLFFSLSTLRESAYLLYTPLQFSDWYWQQRNLPIPAETQRLIRSAYPRVARDPAIRYYVPDEQDRTGVTKFNAERLIQNLPLEAMQSGEAELARRPR